MHPTILLVPPAMVAFAILKSFAGPQKTMQFSRKSAQFLHQLHLLSPRLPAPWELRFLQRCTLPPYVACLELSCAWQNWLALHSQSSTIRIGKRIENGKLLMHAWVTTDAGAFFDAPGFTVCFEDAFSR